ncbi:helix-turn-helix transcriptional regulator [Hansschlegelia zhihuaiae]|uniref:Helix-turn-helix transcriptional regulator n=2 Tax=Hansschlegelia zhihuaiae TaxID=405005 RepID=A0A4V1KJS4_9HYPH|nr:helix-turn-helix transcriptional regulator [Hansschlegelia zhihuaiae]
MPRADTAARIAKAEGVRLEWLVSGEGPKGSQESPGLAPDLTLIPRLDVEAAAGTGSLAVNEEPVALLAFDTEWLRRRGINPKNAHVLTARGDSMEPTIRSGDILLVDTSIDRIEDAGIYIVRVGGLLLLKRIHVKMNRSLTLISDNKEVYPPEEISADEAVDLYVAGRVMWFGRSI